MYMVGNVNHAVSIDENYIFYSNYEKSLTLDKYSLDNICSSLDSDNMYAMFEMVYYAFMYVTTRAKPNIDV